MYQNVDLMNKMENFEIKKYDCIQIIKAVLGINSIVVYRILFTKKI